MGFFTKANSYTLIKKVVYNLSRNFYTYYYIVKKGIQWKCKLKKQFKNNGTILQPACV